MSVGASKLERMAPAGGGPSRALLFLVIFLVAAMPIVLTPIVPAVDFYSHVARYFVLARVDGDPNLALYYAPRWEVLPNIGLDVIGAGLLRFVPTLTAAKLIVLGVFAVQYFGLLAFNRALNGRASLLTAILAVPLLYSFILGWGFANFLLGVGLVFWGGAWWISRRDQLRIGLPVACVLAVMIFLTHGVAFALYGLLLGGLELGYFLTAQPRSLAALARQLAALAAQAVTPVVLFLASPTSQTSDGLTNADEAIHRLAAAGELGHRLKDLVTYRLTTIVRVSESPSFALDVATFVLAAVLLLLLSVRRRLSLPAVAWPVLGIGALLVLFTPPTLFGVGYVADRMPLFLAFALVAALASRPPRGRIDIACVAGLALIVAVKLAWMAVAWQAYRQDMSDYRTVASTIPRHSLVAYVNELNSGRLDSESRCQMFGPLLIPLHGQATGIFAHTSQQPLALLGRLKESMDRLTVLTSAEPRRRVEAILNRRLFDYVLVCSPDHAQPHGRPLARAGHFALYSSGSANRP